MDRVEEIFWQEIMDRPYHLNRKGYAILSCLRDCPIAWRNGQIYRCRYVAWTFGILKDPTDTVHHKDKDKLNDHPTNLAAMSREAHSEYHAYAMPEVHKRKILAGLNQYYETNRRLIGTAMPPSRIEALSKSHKGKRLSAKAKAKLSAANTGREITWGNKISASLKAKGIKPPSELAWAACRGKKQTEEHKAKVAISRARRWEKAKPLLEERKAEWESLIYLGATRSAIARAFEVSPATVTRVLGRSIT